MSEIVEDLKLSTLEITTGLGINFSATDGYITHHGEGDINMNVMQENSDIILTTTDTGVVVVPGKFEAGRVFQEYQPTTAPPSYGLLVPTGAVIPYAGGSAPAGWLLCNGASLLRTEYSTLFATIGVTYGSVDGTHFTLPDLRSRIPLGAGSGAGLTARTLAATGGQEAITTVPPHTHDASTSAKYYSNTDADANYTAVENLNYATGNGTTGTVTVTNNGTNIAVGAVDVMNPFLVLNYIIKV